MSGPCEGHPRNPIAGLDRMSGLRDRVVLAFSPALPAVIGLGLMAIATVILAPIGIATL